MSADERLAIWRYATPEERQRVIDAPVRRGADFNIIVPMNVMVFAGYPCCPWGVAFNGSDEETMQHVETNPDFPEPDEIANALLDRVCPVDEGWTEQKSEDVYEQINKQAHRFVSAWDTGEIEHDDLIAYLHRLNAEEAAQ